MSRSNAGRREHGARKRFKYHRKPPEQAQVAGNGNKRGDANGKKKK